MIEELSGEAATTCDAVDCDRSLPEDPALVFRTDAGERRAYECSCGAVTMTIARRPDPTP